MGEQRGDIRIDVAGVIPPGNYGSIVVNGTGNADDDIEAGTVTINGVCNFGGGVKAGTFVSNGACHVADSLEAERIHAEGGVHVGDRLVGKEVKLGGVCRIGDDVEAASLKIEGDFDVGDGVKSDTISVTGGVRVGDAIEAGSLQILGHLRAEEVRAKGRASVTGGMAVETLEAGEADLDLDAGSRAECIKAPRIRIRARGGTHKAPGRRIDEEVRETVNENIQRLVEGIPGTVEKAIGEAQRAAKMSGFAGRIAEAIQTAFKAKPGGEVPPAEHFRKMAARLEQEAQDLRAKADNYRKRAEAIEGEFKNQQERTREEEERKSEDSPEGGK